MITQNTRKHLINTVMMNISILMLLVLPPISQICTLQTKITLVLMTLLIPMRKNGGSYTIQANLY